MVEAVPVARCGAAQDCLATAARPVGDNHLTAVSFRHPALSREATFATRAAILSVPALATLTPILGDWQLYTPAVETHSEAPIEVAAIATPATIQMVPALVSGVEHPLAPRKRFQDGASKPSHIIAN